jgi:hypothetical protein
MAGTVLRTALRTALRICTMDGTTIVDVCRLLLWHDLSENAPRRLLPFGVIAVATGGENGPRAERG